MKPSPLRTPNLGPPIHSCNTELPSRLNNVSMPVPPFLPTRATTIRRTVEFQSKLHLPSPSSSFSPRRFKNHSAAEKADVGKCSSGIVEAANEPSSSKLLQVVLVSPQIPGNTGCIARTCAASAVGLHLVGPLGFQIDDAKLKRAGLDYWPYVIVKVHRSWAEFQGYFKQQEGEKRLLAFTKRGTITHSDFSFKCGDWLVFGSETSGLLPEVLNDCTNGPYGGGTLRIPMVETYVRCLNLSVSVGIALYEASRQLGYEQMQLHSGSSPSKVFMKEDIFC
ncbi:uncharacterized protein LOC116256516 [Nymphaea colorata]|nr:uncharacterized protein LOC116256516 [Nymphaea colorata]